MLVCMNADGSRYAWTGSHEGPHGEPIHVHNVHFQQSTIRHDFERHEKVSKIYNRLVAKHKGKLAAELDVPKNTVNISDREKNWLWNVAVKQVCPASKGNHRLNWLADAK